MDSHKFNPHRKILKAKRSLGKRSPAYLSSSASNTSSLIKPSLSKRGSSTNSKKGINVASLPKLPSFTKKASITKEINDIATSALALDSGSHIGKTGVITEDDIGADVDVMEVDVQSAFSETGGAVVTSLRKSLSGTGSMAKKLVRKQSSGPGSAINSEVLLLPRGGQVEVAFSFDTTGSMYGFLDVMKSRIKEVVQKLQTDIPGIRIAIFAHGDYCDKDNYIIKWIDFGATLSELHEFVNSCGRTSGGDGPECYELVLRRATEVLSWTPGSKRSLVIIGDDKPHEPGYTYEDFTNDINWRDECTKLKDMGVRVYGVPVAAGKTEKKFYKNMAKRTDGLMITVDSYCLIFYLIIAICYREGRHELLKTYKEELEEKYKDTGLSKKVSRIFSDLSRCTGTGLYGKATGTDKTSGPILPGTTTDTRKFGGTVESLPEREIFNPASRTVTARLSPETEVFNSTSRTVSARLRSKTEILRPTAKTITTRLRSKTQTPKNTTLALERIKGRKTKNAKSTKARGNTVRRNATNNVPARSGKRQKNKETEIPREKKNDRIFKKTKPLNHLQWSNWKLAMSPTNNKNTEWTKWINGYCAKHLFTRDVEAAAVYELAIQPPLRKNKYVVAFSVVQTLPLSGKWSRKILDRKDIRQKCKQAIQQKAFVYVRRGKFKKRNKKFMDKVRKFLTNSNYAFGTSKKKARLLKVKDFTIGL